MINMIVFSMDRACQLRLLLESIDRNAKGVFNVNVFYRASDEQYEAGYAKLRAENFPVQSWTVQDDFRAQFINLVGRSVGLTCVIPDDCLFYRTVDEQVIFRAFSDQDVLCFSLRLGLNTTQCYMLGTDNDLHDEQRKVGYIEWDWSTHDADNGYPLAVDGHIFRTVELGPLVKQIDFDIPSTLEANLQSLNRYHNKLKMAAFAHSVVVNTPVNKVQTLFGTKCGLTFPRSTKELNDLYLSGKVIDYDKLDFSEIKGCHQELEFKMNPL